MHELAQSVASFPFQLTSPTGLQIDVNANGSIRRINHHDIMLNLYLGNEMEGGLTNIYLRRLGATVATIPLLGPLSPATYTNDARSLRASGQWGEIAFRLQLVLAESATAWFWHVELENMGTEAITCDLIHTQDVALAHYGAIRLNEFYVSQYVDHTALLHPDRGTAVASRQNQSMGGRCPWTVIGSLARGVSYATDALQFYGLATRAGGEPPALAAGLPGKRLQHEHSLVAIQDEQVVIEPQTTVQRGFFGWLDADQPAATSPADVSQIDAALALPEAKPTPWPEFSAASECSPSLFTTAPLLESLTLDAAAIEALVGPAPRHAERESGELLSCFTGAQTHLVLMAKERKVLRPHGLLLRSGSSLTPDEAALTSTAWMNGVFHSMITQGHVSINRFLSTCHSYLGLFRSHGQRVFIEIDGRWQLLAMPSAFEMKPDGCRWIYQHLEGRIEVVSSAPDSSHELRLELSVLAGPPARFLISHHVAINGDDGSSIGPVHWKSEENGVLVMPHPEGDVGRRFPEGGFLLTPTGETEFETIGGDELLFADGHSRYQPFLCFITAPALSAGLVIQGRLIAPQAMPISAGWDVIGAGLKIHAPQASSLATPAAQMEDIFPWFIQNALVHYLSPRGLEQYSGGGWGTRDVCQGPVELLLALGRFEPIRDLLCRVFRQQDPDGDWPQWFMFFDRERNIRPDDSHGDIVYWPVLALAQYLTATGDAGLLDETLPFFHDDGDEHAEQATLRQHVERALELIQNRVIAGTRLAAYGHGDWNDSLQPAKPDMRDHLCSAWTVTLNYQTFIALATAFRQLGYPDQADNLDAQASAILAEFQSILVADGVLAGLAYFHEGGRTDLLLHPQDQTTGLSYSLLPMIHAIINDMFSKPQAEAHLALIREHMLGPDGAHLFDRPMAYHGGIQQNFQRAESASFFGREIGIMYTHAHLRYCEALARFGEADDFFHSLCQLNPIGLRELVPTATLRQANCYYSSSDPAFADRYEAFEDYAKVRRGEVALEGGWRVYSSGAGIGVRLILQCFLGIRQEQSALIIDPVIPAALDGLQVNLQLAGHPIAITYQIADNGHGPLEICLNGHPLEFIREANLYRPGAARIAMHDVANRLTENNNHLSIRLS